MTAAVVHLIAAARPNFMKVAPVYHALSAQAWCRPVLVHTGQHYDANMSGTFLTDLGLPQPDHALGVGSGSHAEQTAGVLTAYEALCLSERPDWTVVVGDVNSTLAATLAAVKLHVPVAHLEAGLRSGDRRMPEEINRIVTDALAAPLWTPSPDADQNLLREGIDPSVIERVGNVMIDSFEMMRPRIEALEPWRELGLDRGGFAVVTLHRPVNVDDPARLADAVEMLRALGQALPLVFPVHPRTKARLEDAGLFDRLGAAPGVHLTDPMPYVRFMAFVMAARYALTDSGGIQEETTYLGIPCLTLRDSTERPITLSQGTNRLVRFDSVAAAAEQVLAGDAPAPRRPELWDGRTAARVAASLARWLGAEFTEEAQHA